MSVIAQRAARWFTLVGIALALLSQTDALAGKIRCNQLAIAVVHALSSQEAERLDRAGSHLSALRDSSSNDPQATIWWAYVQMARGELTTLVPLLESEEIAGSERHRPMLIRLGDMFLEDLDVPRFRRAWEQAGVWGVPPQARWFQVLGASRQAIQAEEWDAALDLLRTLEAWDPDAPRVNRYLAVVLMEGYGDVAGAIAKREDVVAAEPDSYWDLMALGNLYVEAGRLDHSEAAFERAAVVDPGQGRAVIELTKALRARGRLEEAALVMEEFLERHPDNDFVLVQLAGVYRDQGQDAAAVGLLEAFVERNPHNGPALVTLGFYHERAGRLDEARTLIERALRQDGDSSYLAWGHDILASIAASRGDDEGAGWHRAQAEAIREKDR